MLAWSTSITVLLSGPIAAGPNGAGLTGAGLTGVGLIAANPIGMGLVVAGLIAVGLIGAGLAIRLLWLRELTRRRWNQSADAPADAAGLMAVRAESRGWLGQWMYLAGYRSEWAGWAFLGLTVIAILVGTGAALAFWGLGLQDLMERTVVLVPGGVGETFLPIVWVGPWIVAIIVSCLPWVIVRKARRKRVELIEQDLPLALELLSTLSEAGLGFDAALTRILKTRLAGRPLAAELRMFQADLLAGRPRVASLRRFSARIQVPSVSSFVSALVQAEQLGMGIARVLRLQAEDVRSRRRERSIAFANSLPVKRVIPLVVCFLPGLFVWTLGPAFVQLFKMAEAFIQVRDF